MSHPHSYFTFHLLFVHSLISFSSSLSSQRFEAVTETRTSRAHHWRCTKLKINQLLPNKRAWFIGEASSKNVISLVIKYKTNYRNGKRVSQLTFAKSSFVIRLRFARARKKHDILCIHVVTDNCENYQLKRLFTWLHFGDIQLMHVES